MEIFDAIFNRRSIGKVKQDAVSREVIEKLLSAAVQAPNHYKLRPWRFVVLTGTGREKLGEVFGTSFKRDYPQVDDEAIAMEKKKTLRAPVLIAVGVDKSTDSKVPEIENIAAVSAAIQNLLLAATALGLGVQWRTGAAVLDVAVKEFLGFSSDQHVLGVLYVGYPDNIPPATVARPSFEDRTVWIEE